MARDWEETRPARIHHLVASHPGLRTLSSSNAGDVSRGVHLTAFEENHGRNGYYQSGKTHSLSLVRTIWPWLNYVSKHVFIHYKVRHAL